MSVIACSKCGAKNRVDPGASPGLRPVCGKCGTPLDVRAASSDSGKPRKVTDSNFTDELSKAGSVPLLIDCWADWCQPCHMVAPVLDELAAESNGRFVIAKLNVDDNPQTASQFNVRSIPTMLIFKNGQLVDRLVGVQSKQAIEARLR